MKIGRWILVAAVPVVAWMFFGPSNDEYGWMGDAQRQELNNGKCLKNNLYLTDEQFLDLVLREQAKEVWQGRYPSPQAFIADHDGCCEVKRMPRESDWRPGFSETMEDDNIAYSLARLGPSRYLVRVSIAYPSTKDPENFVDTANWYVGACGDAIKGDTYSTDVNKREWDPYE